MRGKEKDRGETSGRGLGWDGGTYRVVGEPSVKLFPAVRLPRAVHPRFHALPNDPHIALALREARHEVVGVVPQDLEGLVQAQRAVAVCVSDGSSYRDEWGKRGDREVVKMSRDIWARAIRTGHS